MIIRILTPSFAFPATVLPRFSRPKSLARLEAQSGQNPGRQINRVLRPQSFDCSLHGVKSFCWSLFFPVPPESLPLIMSLMRPVVSAAT